MGDTLVVNGKEIRLVKLAANSWKAIGLPVEIDGILYGFFLTNRMEKVGVRL